MKKSILNYDFAQMKSTYGEFILKAQYGLFSVYLILYAIFSLSLLEVQIFPTINRITYPEQVSWIITGVRGEEEFFTLIILLIVVIITFKKHISLPYIFALIFPTFVMLNLDYNLSKPFFLSTLPVILFFLWISKYKLSVQSKNKFLIDYHPSSFNLNQFLKIFFYVFMVFESFVVIWWLAYPFTIKNSFGHGLWSLHQLESDLFYSFGLLAPHLILLSILSFLINPVFRKKLQNIFDENKLELTKKDHVKISEGYSVHGVSQKKAKVKKTVFDNETKTLILLTVIVLLPSALLPIYSYTVMSSTNYTTATDVPAYLDWYKALESSSQDVPSFFNELFGGLNNPGSRAFSILVIYLIASVTSQIEETLQYLPVLLGPVLAISAYFLTRTAYPEDRRVAFLASLLTAFSYQIIVGFYAAFFANWMALISLYSASIFLIRCLRGNPEKRFLLGFTVFVFLTLLFHSYTWSYFIVVIFLFLIWTGIQRRNDRKKIGIIVPLEDLIQNFLSPTRRLYRELKTLVISHHQ